MGKSWTVPRETLTACRLIVAAGAAVVTAAACGGPRVDIAEAIEVSEVQTGWYDMGIQDDGLNKLVPSVEFTLTNVAEVPVTTVQLNAVFRRISEEDEWGAAFTRAIGADGLEPGGTSTLTLRSNLGYTSTEPRAVMLTHSQFVDAHVQVFAKQGSASWTLLGEWDIDRTMIEAEPDLSAISASAPEP